MSAKSPPPAAAPADSDADAVGRFEMSMSALEEIVARMEAGELRLEEALALFERGMQLSQECRRSLDTAELRLRTLLDPDGSA